MSKEMRLPSDLIDEILSLNNKKQRLVISIAGAPGAGKSTLSQTLCHGLNNKFNKEIAIVVPMDGYHLCNQILEKKGLLTRKGSPDTFDVTHLLNDLSKIHQNNQEVDIPIFDRAKDCVITKAKKLSMHHRLVLLEGNYLLLDHSSWQKVRHFTDLSIFLKVPMTTLKDRLIKRWIDHGLTQNMAIQRALLNDIPNAHFVYRHSSPADIVFVPDNDVAVSR